MGVYSLLYFEDFGKRTHTVEDVGKRLEILFIIALFGFLLGSFYFYQPNNGLQARKNGFQLLNAPK